MPILIPVQFFQCSYLTRSGPYSSKPILSTENSTTPNFHQFQYFYTFDLGSFSHPVYMFSLSILENRANPISSFGILKEESTFVCTSFSKSHQVINPSLLDMNVFIYDQENNSLFDALVFPLLFFVKHFSDALFSMQCYIFSFLVKFCQSYSIAEY